MTDLIVIEASIMLYVPFPPTLVESVRQENAAALEALKDFPHHAATLVRIGDSPEVNAFIEALDFAEIREKFRRTAKKLSLVMPSGDFPVSIFNKPSGVTLSARALK